MVSLSIGKIGRAEYYCAEHCDTFLNTATGMFQSFEKKPFEKKTASAFVLKSRDLE